MRPVRGQAINRCADDPDRYGADDAIAADVNFLQMTARSKRNQRAVKIGMRRRQQDPSEWANALNPVPRLIIGTRRCGCCREDSADKSAEGVRKCLAVDQHRGSNCGIAKPTCAEGRGRSLRRAAGKILRRATQSRDTERPPLSAGMATGNLRGNCHHLPFTRVEQYLPCRSGFQRCQRSRGT